MVPDEIRNLLSAHALFGGLPDHDLRRFTSTLSTQRLDKDQYLFIQGDVADAAYVVIKGQGLLESTSVDGERLFFDKLVPGRFFGEFALLDDGPRSTSAVATTPITLVRIPKKAFLELISEHPDFAMRLIKHLVKLMRHADAHLESMKFKNLPQKVAHFLVREYLRSQPENGVLALTQTDIARAVSASREKVNKAIQTLKTRGIVQTARGRTTILDIEALKKIYSDI